MDTVDSIHMLMMTVMMEMIVYRLPMMIVNSLWPNDAIWQQISGSTLAQVMGCCLTAPSHYLSQCWLIIHEVPWHSSGCIIIRRSEETNQQNKIENCSFKMASRSPRGQWVNWLAPGRCDSDFESMIGTHYMKLLSGECHRTSLMRSRHWFR